MRFNKPLDKILNNEVKVRALRILCQNTDEMSGRQIAKMVGVTPKTAHEILQGLLREGVLVMRPVGKTHLFRLNEERSIAQEVLKPLFLSEKTLSERLFDIMRAAIKKSALQDNILSFALFGSIHAKTERPASDIDLLVVGKAPHWEISKGALKLHKQLGREVNVVDFSEVEFRDRMARKDPFVTQVLRDPHINVI